MGAVGNAVAQEYWMGAVPAGFVPPTHDNMSAFRTGFCRPNRNEVVWYVFTVSGSAK